MKVLDDIYRSVRTSDAIGQSKISEPVERIRSTGTRLCVCKKIGNCANCPVAQATVEIIRWGGLTKKEAIQLTKPICSGLYQSKYEPGIDHLQNKNGSSAFGGGATGQREENWQR